jgi:hypothetical protein
MGLLYAPHLECHTNRLHIPKGSLAVERTVLTLRAPSRESECRPCPLDARINRTSTSRPKRRLSGEQFICLIPALIVDTPMLEDSTHTSSAPMVLGDILWLVTSETKVVYFLDVLV